MRLKRRCKAIAAVFFQGTDEGGFTASLFCAWSWLEMDGGYSRGYSNWIFFSKVGGYSKLLPEWGG